MRRNVLCFAHGRPGAWEALCIDFDIAVTGPSFEAVRACLNDAIASYVEDAMKEAEPDRSRLLARRAPLAVRLGLLWRFALGALRLPRRESDELNAGFSLPCPA